MSNPSWWKGAHPLPDDIIAEIEAQIDSIRGAWEDLPADENAEERSRELIQHYLARTDAIEARRGNALRSSLQMLAISVAGAGLLLRFGGWPENPLFLGLLVAVLAALVLLAITSFRTISIYYWQTKSDRYHFLDFEVGELSFLGNSWLWFYHGNPPLSDIPFTAERSEANDSKAAVAYIKGAEYFFTRASSLSSQDTIKENLRHAYLLQVHNAYKNKFDRQLVDRIHWGVKRIPWVAGIAFVAAFALGSSAIFETPNDQVDRMPAESSAVVDEAPQTPDVDSLQRRDKPNE